jgi:phosphomethylpyrimidine synthase
LPTPTTTRNFGELKTLGRTDRQSAWKHDVQTMIEGPGHVPMQLIKAKHGPKQLEHGATKRRSTRLGPLVTTDIAPGYDHITSAIGAAQYRLVWHGDAVLRHPERASRPARYKDDVKEPASSPTSIAAHAADLAKGHGRARRLRDNALSKARFRIPLAKTSSTLRPRSRTGPTRIPRCQTLPAARRQSRAFLLDVRPANSAR